jgi:hypothetical protein
MKLKSCVLLDKGASSPISLANIAKSCPISEKVPLLLAADLRVSSSAKDDGLNSPSDSH